MIVSVRASGAAPDQDLDKRWPSVGFLFVGGEHQMLHIAPVAAELVRRGGIDVRAFVGDADEERALHRLMVRLGVSMSIERLPSPGWTRMLGRINPRWSALKLPRLLAARAMLGRLDVLVVAERTSTLLNRLPGPHPCLIHIPHGMGDRAKGFERRIKMFDHVIVSGPKDRARMIASGVVSPENCSVSGSIKLEAVAARPPGPPLFANGRPVVLYNPHFAAGLSSWPKFGRGLIAAFRDQDRFNLIVAPHVRLKEAMSPAERSEIEALAVDGRIIVDLGSPRSHDMSYTRAADIYLGDVSSQVYEFLSRPRPCVFLDTGHADWANDPNFAFWHLGEVVSDPALAFEAVTRAAARHGTFVATQIKAASQAIGPLNTSPAATAAAIIIDHAYRHNDRHGRLPNGRHGAYRAINASKS